MYLKNCFINKFNFRLKLSSQCLYALSIAHYRNNNNEEALKYTRACLAISGPYLSDIIQSSAWFILARCVTNDYSMVIFFFYYYHYFF